MKKIRTRFAPSPTGFLHVGGARTALYSWLFARHYGGEFILRIEDTDVEREKEGAVEAILQAMKWLGMTWDDGPYYQTQRLNRYNQVIDELLASGHAYRCYCSRQRLAELKQQQELQKQKPHYDGYCLHHNNGDPSQPHVVRLKCPEEGTVSWQDLIRGNISFNNSEFDDFIIRRTDGWPTYNFCVVIDDIDMQISHIIRAEEHINNTPKQIYVYQALKQPLPFFAHVSPILGDDNKKLSKRHGAVSVMQYEQDGFLPQALLNYLVRLGWGYKNREIFSVEEMIQLFDIIDVSKSPSAFNTKKLLWLNKHYITKCPVSELRHWLEASLKEKGIIVSEDSDMDRIISLYQGRSQTLKEMAESVSCYYLNTNLLSPEIIGSLANNCSTQLILSITHRFYTLKRWEYPFIMQEIELCADQFDIKLKEIYMDLRLIIFGSKDTPSLGECLAVLGKKNTLVRLQNYLNIIS